MTRVSDRGPAVLAGLVLLRADPFAWAAFGLTGVAR